MQRLYSRRTKYHVSYPVLCRTPSLPLDKYIPQLSTNVLMLLLHASRTGKGKSIFLLLQERSINTFHMSFHSIARKPDNCRQWCRHNFITATICYALIYSHRDDVGRLNLESPQKWGPHPPE